MKFFCIAGGLTIHCRFPSVAPHTVWHVVYGMASEDHVQLELKKNWFYCKFLLCFGLWKFGWRPVSCHPWTPRTEACWDQVLNADEPKRTIWVLVEWNRRYKKWRVWSQFAVRNSMKHALHCTVRKWFHHAMEGNSLLLFFWQMSLDQEVQLCKRRPALRCIRISFSLEFLGSWDFLHNIDYRATGPRQRVVCQFSVNSRS